MTVRFEDALASLPAAEQAAIQARYEELWAAYDRDHAAAVEGMREAKRAAHAAARAVIQKRKNAVGRDADLPATESFHA